MHRQQATNFKSLTFKHVAGEGAASEADMRSLVEKADLVFNAMGFHARVPTLTDIDDKPLQLAVSPSDGQILHATPLPGQLPFPRRVSDGTPVTNLFMYGLGSGLFADATYGGEPRSYGRARLDGVWLYQFDIGKHVV